MLRIIADGLGRYVRAKLWMTEVDHAWIITRNAVDGASAEPHYETHESILALEAWIPYDRAIAISHSRESREIILTMSLALDLL